MCRLRRLAPSRHHAITPYRGGSGDMHSVDKWIAALTAAILAVSRGQDEQATPSAPQPGVQGEGGRSRREGREDFSRADADL